MSNEDKCSCCGSKIKNDCLGGADYDCGASTIDGVYRKTCPKAHGIAIKCGVKIDKARAILQTPNKYFEEMETDLYELFGL